MVTGSPVEVRNSPITLPMTRRLAFSNVSDLLRHDEALIAALTEYNAHGRRDSVPLKNFHWGYTVSVDIGNPTRTYELIVDSASAITWVGGHTQYVSSTGTNIGVPVGGTYQYGSFQGTLFEDSMTFGTDELSIDRMRFGVASTSQGFAFDGVLGIGPRGLTHGTLPTVVDYLVQQYAIRRPIVGIFFKPIGVGAALIGDGEISFGGANRQRYTGTIRYTDITDIPPSSQYWGINQRITYGDTPILDYTAGIVNCGYTFLYIASDAFERYQAATGGTMNAANGLLQISHIQYLRLHNLYFHIGQVTYIFVPNAQIWPRSLNHKLDGGGDDDIFLVVKGLEFATGSGLDFINGYVFLQRFYVVFSGSMRPRIGFARTLYSRDESN
ncbi:aspartic peptidase domain-containing protein [Suillus spraguei]|nr:aspartic peptidase domain-containing protein [Suillus spraguei]